MKKLHTVYVPYIIIYNTILISGSPIGYAAMDNGKQIFPNCFNSGQYNVQDDRTIS